MIFRFAVLIISFMILQACSVLSQDVSLSSGVQYIGKNQKIISQLEKLEIIYQNSVEIDLEATDKKFILIEPNNINDISMEDVAIALEKGYYVFFINLVNDRRIQEKFLNQKSFDMRKDENKWVKQIYYGNDGLTSLNISTNASMTDNLSIWLKTLDESKQDSK
jgi:hypothetical protein